MWTVIMLSPPLGDDNEARDSGNVWWGMERFGGGGSEQGKQHPNHWDGPRGGK